MSDSISAFLIPACLVGCYPVMLLATHLWPKHHSPRTLKWIHWGGWGFALLQLVVMAMWRLSMRGQWLDALPFALAWLAAGSYFLLRRGQMGWVGKIYFGGWFAYPAALAGAFLLDRIFFVLVSLPLLAFFPNEELYTGPECTIRAAGGLMAPPRFALLTPVGPLLERHHGVINAGESKLDSIGRLGDARILPAPHSDTITVLVSGLNGQQQVAFPRR